MCGCKNKINSNYKVNNNFTNKKTNLIINRDVTEENEVKKDESND